MSFDVKLPVWMPMQRHPVTLCSLLLPELWVETIPLRYLDPAMPALARLFWHSCYAFLVFVHVLVSLLQNMLGMSQPSANVLSCNMLQFNIYLKPQPRRIDMNIYIVQCITTGYGASETQHTHIDIKIVRPALCFPRTLRQIKPRMAWRIGSPCVVHYS